MSYVRFPNQRRNLRYGDGTVTQATVIVAQAPRNWIVRAFNSGPTVVITDPDGATYQLGPSQKAISLGTPTHGIVVSWADKSMSEVIVTTDDGANLLGRVRPGPTDNPGYAVFALAITAIPQIQPDVNYQPPVDPVIRVTPTAGGTSTPGGGGANTNPAAEASSFPIVPVLAAIAVAGAAFFFLKKDEKRAMAEMERDEQLSAEEEKLARQNDDLYGMEFDEE